MRTITTLCSNNYQTLYAAQADPSVLVTSQIFVPVPVSVDVYRFVAVMIESCFIIADSKVPQGKGEEMDDFDAMLQRAKRGLRH